MLGSRVSNFEEETVTVFASHLPNSGDRGMMRTEHVRRQQSKGAASGDNGVFVPSESGLALQSSPFLCFRECDVLGVQVLIKDVTASTPHNAKFVIIIQSSRNLLFPDKFSCPPPFFFLISISAFWHNKFLKRGKMNITSMTWVGLYRKSTCSVSFASHISIKIQARKVFYLI